MKLLKLAKKTFEQGFVGKKWRSLRVLPKARLLLPKFALFYSVVCVLLYFQQQRLIFFPSHQIKNTPMLYELKYDEIKIAVENDSQEIEYIHGWWIPAQDSNAPVMLYFHHNAVNIGANVSQALQFHQLGYSVFLFDYRGFGKSKGDFPTESRVYEDAEATWNYLSQKRQISPNQIVIYGHSVGGAIAIDLAAKHPEAAALIVQSSFTSIRDMTRRFGLFWILPIDLILTQEFKSLQKMKSIEMPVLIITGTKDIQIPVEMGKNLYKAASGLKKLIIVEGGGHDNHLSEKHQKELQTFINSVN